ncbi:unnamed protein product [Camellia sinensis]
MTSKQASSHKPFNNRKVEVNKMVALKVFFAFLIGLLISAQGFAQCFLSSINVKITKTGSVVKGQSEFEVVFSNNCACIQYNIAVKCDGFSSVEPIDPAIFRKDDSVGGCLLKNGESIPQGEPLKFKFAGQIPIDKFKPISSTIACS